MIDQGEAVRAGLKTEIDDFLTDVNKGTRFWGALHNSGIWLSVVCSSAATVISGAAIFGTHSQISGLITAILSAIAGATVGCSKGLDAGDRYRVNYLTRTELKILRTTARDPTSDIPEMRHKLAELRRQHSKGFTKFASDGNSAESQAAIAH